MKMFRAKCGLSNYWLLFVAVFVLGVTAIDDAKVLQPVNDVNDELIQIYKVSINKLLDKHIDDIRKSLAPLDPITLKDLSWGWSKIKYSLSRGVMQNLPYVSRSGDCNLTYKNRQLFIDLKYRWNDVSIDYRYEYKFLLYKKTGDLHAQLRDIDVNLVYKYDFKTHKMSMETFVFENVGDLDIKTEGNILDKLGKKFVELLTSFLRNYILEVIEDNFRELLQSNMPARTILY